MDAYESAKRIMRRPAQKYTKEEALVRLREIGVLTNNNMIRKEYREVFVMVKKDGSR